MSNLVAEIAEKMQLLSADDKHALLRMLLQDIDGPGEDADEAWRNEVVRRVKAIRNGEAAIRALQGASVVFEDGTEEAAEAIIWCTGYRVSFPFFEPGFLPVAGNAVPLWNRTLLPGVPDLFFVGLYQPLGSIMQPAELQGRIIGERLLGRIGFPDEATMRREMAAEQRALQRRYSRSPRHTMQVDFWPFMHRLQRMLDGGRRLARKTEDHYMRPIP